MRKSLQMTVPQSPQCDQTILVPSNQFAIVESFEKKEQSWFATSPVPTDLIIQVQDITFYIHRYPLISRSEYMSQLNLPPSSSNFGYDLKLDNFPGGSETFEIILKFCYGLPVDLSATNVVPLRCASEFLQMTEEFEEGNLISKTEAFLAFIVLSSWRDSITVLKSCESLTPWAENLQIVRRCIDSIASKATIDNSLTGETSNDKEWWFEDVTNLRIDHFIRIITAIKAKGLKPEIIGACIMKYAEKWLPGMNAEIEGQRGYGYGTNEFQLSILSGRREEGSVGPNKEHRMMIEVLVSILPPQRDAVPCKFLLWMLKMAVVYSATPALVSELETRVGMVLEDATVNDLLIPVYKNGNEGALGSSPFDNSTMHDVDMMQRILEYYLIHAEQRQHQPPPQKCGKLDVGKLLDGYLAEIARDPNLSISKFQVLAEALPENARTCHDGLYRAIDTYIKTHPTITEHDRRRLCKAMDCEKLSLDACMHGAQNDRLPLRTVIQVTFNYKVLFSEQGKMREAIKEKEPMPTEIFVEQESAQSSTKKEIKSIKAELEKVRTKMAELQNDYSVLQNSFEKINKQKSLSSWISGWKKFKNSTFFHGKMGSEDMGEMKHSKDGRRRRVSVS